MRVLIAPDSFGGTLTAREAARAIAAGWRATRPDDEVALAPLSDGGEGLLETVVTDADRRHELEVAGPQGHPVRASFLVRDDGTALIEAALADGLALVPPDRRTPARATSYGVGQLLAAAVTTGCRRVAIGLGGSASVDGGTGALLGLGFRLTVADGSGLKIGGADLHRLAAVDRGWAPELTGVEIELLADVTATLDEAAPVFGPQKGADARQIEELTAALRHVASVMERDLGADPGLRDVPGAGAAGGLGYGLMAAAGARLVPGAARLRELTGVHERLPGVDLVVTGEGRLDATSGQGKVIGGLLEEAAAAGVDVAAVVGSLREPLPGLTIVEESAPDGPGEDPAAEVRAAAARLAATFG